MLLKKSLASFAVLALMVGAFVGCTQEEATPADNPDEPVVEEPVFGGELVLSYVGEPTVLNPILSTGGTTSLINDYVFEGLVATNENLEIIPLLAENWSFNDETLVVTFNLKKGVKWHDGEEFTADDVKFTYDTIMHPDYTGIRARNFKAVKEVIVRDEHTVELHLNQADSALVIKVGGLGIIAEHIFGEAEVANLREHEGNSHPIGTGPYKFVEWEPAQRIVLTANTDYYQEGPYIETLRFKAYNDSDVELAGFEMQDIDYLDNIPIDDIERIKADHGDWLNFQEGPNNRYEYIGLKQTHPILKDKNIRKALMYGLDRKSMIDSLFKGYATPVHTHYPPVSWAFNPNVHDYPYDKERAIGLLEEAGWNTIGDDGIRVKDGERLSFVLVTGSGSQVRENIMSMATEYWKEIGLEVDVQYFEMSVLFDQYLDAAKFESYLWGWSCGIDPDATIFFHSESGVDEDGQLMGFNDVEYSNPAVDELLDQGLRTFDTEERKNIYWEVAEILNEDLPYVFLYSETSVRAMHKKVHGVTWGALGPYFIHEWWIEQ